NLLNALQSSGIPIVDLDTLLRAETRYGVALTFDDGIRTVFTEALPILRKHCVPAHLFLTTNFVGQTNRWPTQSPSAPLFDMLGWSQIDALCSAGIRIEAHTANHPDLRGLADDDLRAECDWADDSITQRVGRRPRYFAYPYGRSDARVRAFARLRYHGSLTTELRPLGAEEDAAALPRLDSYYLKPKWMLRDLSGQRSQAYLEVRRSLRWLRSAIEPWIRAHGRN